VAQPYPHYPQHLVRKATLADGTVLTIRPIRPEDAQIEAEFVRNLSEESRYYRFMDTLRELSSQMLSHFTHVDYDRHMAFIAVTGEGARETEIAVARYIVSDDGTSCEFAVVVADAWQRKGVGTLLMRTLIETAGARGLRRMFGEVLTGNHKMLELMQRLGFQLKLDPGDPRLMRAEIRL
jgi:acetyltransferase